MGVRIEMDASDALREIHRLAGGPGLDDVHRFERVIIAQYQATQAVVHIITGSLRRSGKVDFDAGFTGHQWNGEVTYGGDAPGAVRGYVKYARYEQQRAIGGANYRRARGWLPGTNIQGEANTDHDFMWPVAGFEPDYLEAMLAFLRGGR